MSSSKTTSANSGSGTPTTTACARKWNSSSRATPARPSHTSSPFSSKYQSRTSITQCPTSSFKIGRGLTRSTPRSSRGTQVHTSYTNWGVTLTWATTWKRSRFACFVAGSRMPRSRLRSSRSLRISKSTSLIKMVRPGTPTLSATHRGTSRNFSIWKRRLSRTEMS